MSDSTSISGSTAGEVPSPRTVDAAPGAAVAGGTSAVAPPPDAALDPLAPRLVVGIGASAGGLEALERLFKAMPTDTGMAFVVIQHLSPDFKSLMDELLARFNTMKIHRVDGSVTMRADTIYLLGPRTDMVVEGNVLHSYHRASDQRLHQPINTFFRALAREHTERAAAIVLSGTGSDGSLGIVDVHDMGGLVLVQSQESAKFDGMPRSAVGTGVADAVLPPEQMPAVLLSYARNPTARLLGNLDPQGDLQQRDAVGRIFDQLQRVYDLDFNLYKPTTVTRRLERRVALGHAGTLEAYCQRLLGDAQELDALYRDLLIGVTRFFRDPEAYDLLRHDTLPALVEAAPRGEDVRVWVAGCATGEEAYSIAILVHEAVAAAGREVGVKIFASDMHRESLHVAAEGVYARAALADVPEELRERYFVEESTGNYRVAPRLRKSVIFSPHNLVKDPPFTRIDLVTCRNVLIYFQPVAQTRAVASFYFALKPGGTLLLGPSESVGALDQDFSVADRHWKLYRKCTDRRLGPELRTPPGLTETRSSPSVQGRDTRLLRAYDVLLARYVPTGVLVNERREILHYFGEANRFFRPPPGRASNDAVAMASGELRVALSSALQQAAKRLERVYFRSVAAPDGEGAPSLFDLSVEPIADRISPSPLFAITMTPAATATLAPDVAAAREAAAEGTPFVIDAGILERVQLLEAELQHARESLQTTVEELETSNEELQASNEELLASNEELQSTNEELHSVNEELYSVNAEHEQKIRDLHVATADLRNLMQATEIGSIFIDRNFRVRLFTPAAASSFNLMAQDVGRDIMHITSRIKDDDVFDDLTRVAGSGTAIEKRVTTPEGRVLLRRIKPYVDLDGLAAGLIVTFVDVTELSAAEFAVRASEEQLRQLMDGAPRGMLLCDRRARILRANRGAADMLGFTPEELEGRPVGDLVPDTLRAAHQGHVEGFFAAPTTRAMKGGRVVRGVRKDRTPVDLEVGLNPVVIGGESLVAVYADDVTEQRRMEQALQRSEERFRISFENAGLGKALYHANGEFVLANSAMRDLLGRTHDELAALGFSWLLNPDDAEVGAQLAARLASGEIPSVVSERRFRRPAGDEVWGRLNATVVRDADGVPQQLLAHLENITDYKRLEDERRSIDAKMIEAGKLESLGVLAGGIAHDFNNLLTGILGSASAARIELERLGTAPSLEEGLSTIEETSRRAAELCSQLLAYSGRGRFVVEQENLSRLVEQTSKLLSATLSREITVTYELDHEVPPVLMDTTQIRQVVMNLVINAAEAIGTRGGMISVSTGVVRADRSLLGLALVGDDQAEGDFVFLRVTDNGCGIRASDVRRIFEPFYTTKFTGRGLGLAAVLGIVRGHKGVLTLTSEVGRGSSFLMLLPPALLTQVRRPTSERAGLWRSSGRILVIDDEDVVRGTVRRLLRALGFEVDTAIDGREGVELFAASPEAYRLVILDLTMPYLNGEQVFREIRRITPRQRVLLMSGFNQAEAEANFRPQELAGFMPKPLSMQGLSDAVRRALGE